MPRLTDFLRDLEVFQAALRQARAGPARLVVPSFVRAYVTAGIVASDPWDATPCLVVAPNQDAAEELRREIALYLPQRAVLHLPARGVWYGPEAGVPARVAARRSLALEALAGPAVVVVQAATLMEAALPGAHGPRRLAIGDHVPFDGFSKTSSTWAIAGSTKSRTRASSRCAAGWSMCSRPPTRLR